MPQTLSYRSIPTHCAACGRNLAQDTVHVSGWDGERVTFYCAGYPCDPRNRGQDGPIR